MNTHFLRTATSVLLAVSVMALAACGDDDDTGGNPQR